MQQSSKDTKKYIKSKKKGLTHEQPLFVDYNCIQTEAAYPQIVELPMYFPNVYGLFNAISFNCELQSRKSRLSLEQIIGQGNFRKI